LDAPTCNGNAAPLGVACHAAKCGDGYANTAAGEQCDTLNGVDTNACNGVAAGSQLGCHWPTCGDNYANGAAGETCDASSGLDTATCNGKAAPSSVACRAAQCGDGYINFTAGEECDTPDKQDSDTCNGANAGLRACHKTMCGDGYVNAAANEECDLGPISAAGCTECKRTSQWCEKEADCTACAYRTEPKSQDDCYCVCHVFPFNAAVCETNRKAWEQYCSNAHLICPAEACAAVQAVGCSNNTCVELIFSSP
jgi:ubiquitin